MVTQELQRSLRLFLRSEPTPASDSRVYLDYLTEIEIGASIAQQCLRDRSVISYLAFGFPGNGARSYLRRMRVEFHQQGFNIAWLDIRGLSVSPTEVLRSNLEVLEQILGNDQLRPLALFIDELDALDEGERENPALFAVREPLQRCATNCYDAPLLILAGSVSPAAMRGLMPATPMLYFEWPEPERVAVLLQSMDIPKTADVAALLTEMANERKARYTTSSIIAACRMATKAIGMCELENLAAGEIAKALDGLCTPTPETKVSEYEHRFSDYIAQARTATRTWAQRKARPAHA